MRTLILVILGNGPPPSSGAGDPVSAAERGPNAPLRRGESQPMVALADFIIIGTAYVVAAIIGVRFLRP